MIKCNIAFTGLDSTENPYPGLSVVRSIKDSGEFEGKAVALTYDSLCTGVYQHNLIDEVYLVPFPSESEELLFSRIAEINAKTKIDVIMPCLDSEIATYARLSKRLKSIGISVLVPTEDSVKMRSKIFLQEFCEKHKISYPKSFLINDPNQIDFHAAALHYPLLLKGSIIDSAKANNSIEAHVFFNRLANEWGLPLIIQECLDGEEYDIALLADRGSNVVANVAMKKIGITERGKAYAGAIIASREFDELARKVVRALKWEGPMELELMKNTNLNKTYIIEINARFPMWIYASVAAGANLPLLGLKLALGKEVKPPPYSRRKKDIMFVRIVEDSFCNIKYLAQLNFKGEISWNKEKCLSKNLLT